MYEMYDPNNDNKKTTGMSCSHHRSSCNAHNHPPTNNSATPEMRDITLKDIAVKAGSYLTCDGLPEPIISGIVFDNVTVTGKDGQDCSECVIKATDTKPMPKCKKL